MGGGAWGQLPPTSLRVNPIFNHLDQRFLKPKNFLDTNFISTKQIFWPKAFFRPKFFLSKIFFWPQKIFQHQTFFSTKIFFSTQNIFSTQSIFRPKNCFGRWGVKELWTMSKVSYFFLISSLIDVIVVVIVDVVFVFVVVVQSHTRVHPNSLS